MNDKPESLDLKANWHAGRLRVAALMLADAGGLFLVWLAAVLVYDFTLGIDGMSAADYLRLWPIIPLFVLANIGMRLYHGNCIYLAIHFSPVEEFRRLFVIAVVTHVLLMAFLGYARINTQYSRIILSVSGLAAGILAQPVRNLCRAVLRKAGIGQIPVALVGDAKQVRRAPLQRHVSRVALCRRQHSREPAREHFAFGGSARRDEACLRLLAQGIGALRQAFARRQIRLHRSHHRA